VRLILESGVTDSDTVTVCYARPEINPLQDSHSVGALSVELEDNGYKMRTLIDRMGRKDRQAFIRATPETAVPSTRE